MNRRYLGTLLSTVSLTLLLGTGFYATQHGTSHSTAIAQPTQSAMTVERLERILREETNSVEGSNGQWQVSVGDRTLIILADAPNNRMRIFTPVISASELTAQQIQAMLLANFHTALDARYALSEDTVVASFVHPLDSLNDSYLRSALSQVATLANNFGTSYSSGAIGFGPIEQSDSLPRGSLRI